MADLDFSYDHSTTSFAQIVVNVPRAVMGICLCRASGCWSRLTTSPELVAVISPMYYSTLITTAHNARSTPLGITPVNTVAILKLGSILQAEWHSRLTPVSRDREHSLEIELPYCMSLHPNRNYCPLKAQNLLNYLKRLCNKGGGLWEMESKTSFL